MLGEKTPFYCKSPGCLVNLSCQSCWNNYVAGGRSREVASFLVWDTSGSPMGILAACVACCSTALQAASALESLHKSGNGNASNTGKALLAGGGGSWRTSQCPAWRCLGRGSSKAPLGTCRDWPGPPPSCSPQPAAPASAHAGSACPYCAFCSTS